MPLPSAGRPVYRFFLFDIEYNTVLSDDNIHSAQVVMLAPPMVLAKLERRILLLPAS